MRTMRATRLLLAIVAAAGTQNATATCTSAFFCEHYPDQYNYLCEGTPQGTQYSYTWTRSGTASFPYGCTTEICQVNCSSIPSQGRVYLTVYDNSVPEACASFDINVCG